MDEKHLLTCDQAAPLIVSGSDGTLDDGAMRRLQAHLDACASCRRTFDAQRDVVTALRTAGDWPVPPDFARRVSARLEAGWADVFDWRRWAVRLAPLAAGLIIAAMIFGRASSESPIELAHFVEAWTAQERGAMPVTALFWQRDVSNESLLVTVLAGRPDGTIEELGYER